MPFLVKKKYTYVSATLLPPTSLSTSILGFCVAVQGIPGGTPGAEVDGIRQGARPSCFCSRWTPSWGRPSHPSTSRTGRPTLEESERLPLPPCIPRRPSGGMRFCLHLFLRERADVRLSYSPQTVYSPRQSRTSTPALPLHSLINIFCRIAYLLLLIYAWDGAQFIPA